MYHPVNHLTVQVSLNSHVISTCISKAWCELHIHCTVPSPVAFGYSFDSYLYNVKTKKKKKVPTLLSPLSMLQSELVHCVQNVRNEKGFYFLLKYIYCVYYITLVTTVQ